MTQSSGQQSQNYQQQTVSQPWAPAQPALQSILNTLPSLQNQAGINPTESAAIQQLQTNAAGIPNFGPTVANTAASYLGGDPNNILNKGYANLQGSLGGLANPNNLNPYNTPGFSQALNTLNTDITNQIGSQFAAAGRTGSGMDTQTLARGLAQGEGGLIQGQYNQNVQNLINAAQGIYSGGIGTNTALGQNVSAGGNLAQAVPGLATQGPAALLSAGQAPFNLLAGNQGILAGIAAPIASLGGQTNTQGQSNTQTTQNASALQAALGLGGLFGGQYSPISGIANAASGAAKALGNLFG